MFVPLDFERRPPMDQYFEEVGFTIKSAIGPYACKIGMNPYGCRICTGIILKPTTWFEEAATGKKLAFNLRPLGSLFLCHGGRALFET